MKLIREDAGFKPITLVIEGQAELDSIVHAMGICSEAQLASSMADEGITGQRVADMKLACYPLYQELHGLT